MSFQVVEGAIRKIWCATDGASTYYIGQLVGVTGAAVAYIDGTVSPLPVPAGSSNLTDDTVVFGVVTGNNDENPVFTTVGNQSLRSISGVTTQAALVARKSAGYFGQEGMYIKGDSQPLLEVAVIGPQTVLKGDIYNGALGTVCAIVTDQDGTDATGYTTAGLTDAAPFTPADMLHTYYCRKGTNAGQYRTGVGTSTTAPDVQIAFETNVALGDEFVPVPLKQGYSMPYIDGPGLYFDQGTDAVTNSYEVIVLELNLEVSGKEHAIFMFSANHFLQSRDA